MARQLVYGCSDGAEPWTIAPNGPIRCPVPEHRLPGAARPFNEVEWLPASSGGLEDTFGRNIGRGTLGNNSR